jgi:acetyltransferase-like isoleucine patch superfamily enzyme
MMSGLARVPTTGTGAVIGANSVVNADIPDYAIAVGSPAKVVKYRT